MLSHLVGKDSESHRENCAKVNWYLSRVTLLTRTPRPQQCHQNGVSSPWWRVPHPASSSPWCGWSRRSSDPGHVSTGLKWSNYYAVLTSPFIYSPVSENTECVQLGRGRFILFSQNKVSQIWPILIKVHMRSPPRSRIWLRDLSFFWVTSHVSPELLSHATVLKF